MRQRTTSISNMSQHQHKITVCAGTQQKRKGLHYIDLTAFFPGQPG